MLTLKKKPTRRLSVWVIVFAVMLCTLTGVFALGANAAMTSDHNQTKMHSNVDHAGDLVNGAENAADNAKDLVKDTGNAVKDAGEKVKNNVERMLDDASDGRVTDRDGWIGNNDGGKSVMEMADGSMGWLAWVIAVIVAILAIVLSIILIPKKKEN